MSNLSKGKNFVQRHFDNVYSILSSLDHGYNTNAGLTEYLGIPKQNTNYWLGKLCKEGLVDKPKPGIYEITKSGKKVYRGFKQQLNKDCIRLENMRFKYPIYEGLENLLNDLDLFSNMYN